MPTFPMARDEGPSVGFIPAGPITSASSRLQVYLPFAELRGQRPDAYFLLRAPRKFARKLKRKHALRIAFEVLRKRIGIVVFQKVHRGAAPWLMRFLRLAGRRIIYVECDDRDDLAFARHVDVIVAPSEHLAAHLSQRSGVRSVHIPDPVEYWERQALDRAWCPKQRYRTAWVGNHKNWHQVADLKRSLKSDGLDAFQLITISDHPEADVVWSLETIRADLLRCDLGIIPVTGDQPSSMKSHNRATLFMALGLPLIVSASSVYAGLVRDEETGFVYRDKDDLRRILQRLGSTDLVSRVRANAMLAAEAYSIDRIADRWRDLFVAV